MVSLLEAVGKKVKKFKVGDVEVKFRPRVKDIAVLMAVAAKQDRGEATAEDIQAMLDAVVEMIYRANRDEGVSREDIEAFVVDNLSDVLVGIVSALGLDRGKGFREREQ